MGKWKRKSEEKGSWLRKEETTTGLVVPGWSGVARQAQANVGRQFTPRADGLAPFVVGWTLMQDALLV